MGSYSLSPDLSPALPVLDHIPPYPHQREALDKAAASRGQQQEGRSSPSFTKTACDEQRLLYVPTVFKFKSVSSQARLGRAGWKKVGVGEGNGEKGLVTSCFSYERLERVSGSSLV